MGEWTFYQNVKISIGNDKDTLILTHRPLGPARTSERVPVILREPADNMLHVSRARAAIGRRVLEPVSAYIQGVSAEHVRLADLYQSIALLRGGYDSQRIDLTPRGLAEAKDYFEARAAGRLDSFGRPRKNFWINQIWPALNR